MVRYAGNEASIQATARLVAFTAYTQIILYIVPTQIEVETGPGRKGWAIAWTFPSSKLDNAPLARRCVVDTEVFCTRRGAEVGSFWACHYRRSVGKFGSPTPPSSAFISGNLCF